MQCTVGDDLYNFFSENHPSLIKVMDYQPNSAVIGIPQVAPESAILRENENALEFLERTKKFNLEWVREGHRRGPNTNNVSATCSIQSNSIYMCVSDDGDLQQVDSINSDNEWVVSEWTAVGEWMWKNKNSFNGMSVLPFDGGTYKDAPFMEVSEEVFQEKLDYITNTVIDLTKIIEEVDNTTQRDTIACAGGACEII